jgi:hypothetical protein
MTIDVDDVCTDADLPGLLGTADLLNRLQPSVSSRDVKRANALLDVLEELKKRSPPVYDADLADPEELSDAVGYLALYRLCREARATAGDRWDMLAQDMMREYKGAVARNFTVSGDLRGPGGGSFSLERR